VGWGYDSADRLLQFLRGIIDPDGMSIDAKMALPGVDNMRQYNLDATGNWVDNGFSGSVPAVQDNHDCHPDQQSRTANNLNQIATINGADVSYDAKGNLLANNGLAFTWDGFNRLINADGTGPDGSSTNARYYTDALGRRVRKVNNDTTIDFVPMGNQVVEERDDSNTLLRQYVWGQYVDELIQQREYENAPEGQDSADWYPLTDLLYRSVALTDNTACEDSGGSSGAPFQPNFVEVYDTDVYGRTNIYSDPGPDGQWFTDDDTPTFMPLCAYIYTGKRYEAETGLYLYGGRYYAPDLGRFISRDQILYGDGMNVYQYCGGRPVTHTDPSGNGPVGDYVRDFKDQLSVDWAFTEGAGAAAGRDLEGLKSGISYVGGTLLEAADSLVVMSTGGAHRILDRPGELSYSYFRVLDYSTDGTVVFNEPQKQILGNFATLGLSGEGQAAIAYSYGLIDSDTFSAQLGQIGIFQVMPVLGRYRVASIDDLLPSEQRLVLRRPALTRSQAFEYGLERANIRRMELRYFTDKLPLATIGGVVDRQTGFCMVFESGSTAAIAGRVPPVWVMRAGSIGLLKGMGFKFELDPL
jgi:RHS repeat-associated protein